MKPILKNSIFMALFNIFGRASGFIRYALLVAFLSESHFGIITYAFYIGRLGRTFIDGGLDNLISRDGARNYDAIPSYHLHGLLLKSILAAIFFLAVFVYLFQVRGLPLFEMGVVYAALCGSALLSFTGVTRSCFTAIERMEYIFYTNLPARFLSIVFLFFALWYSLPLAFAAAAVSIENLLWFFLLGYCSLRYFSLIGARISWPTVRYMLSESWSLAAYGFFNVFYLSLDVMMIEYLMGGREAVAPYTYASQLLEGVTMLITGYLIAIYPVLSRYYNSDEAAYQKLFHQSVIVLLSCTIPLTFLLGLWSYEWMNLIKETGAISSHVLRILAVNLNFSLFNTLLIAVFTTRNRQRWLVLFTAFAVLISFLSNWILIPLFGQPGGAYATLFSQFILLVMMTGVAKHLFTLSFPMKKPIQIFFVSLLCGVGLAWIPRIPPLLIPLLYLGLFMSLIRLFGIFTKEELHKIRRAFQR
ncbi:MAG: flippase [Candidatus Omnitrophota bacterium]|nr:MAG: flippase [Candidatus Omnitrophota bacterium]